MSVGGTGIPRLQDLSYVEVAVGQVAAGATFEQVRRGLVSRAAEIARDSDTDGSFDQTKWELTQADPTKHVHNTVDVLKELMRLGWLNRHILPSGPGSAYLHANATFELTEAGREWAALAAEDRRAAYNVLIGVLVDTHPQFEGFLRAVGARPDSPSTHLTIPLFKWDSPVHADADSYLNAFVEYASDAAATGTLGWSASRKDIANGVLGYVSRIRARLAARNKPETRKLLINACEEAMTKVAFAAAGCPLDYISMEVLRHWTRFLGLANFSYYAPGPNGLRLWATGRVTGRGPNATITRSVGPEVRRKALEGLWETWQQRRSEASSGMYIAIWELRAAVCWQQRINDDEFDRAVAELLAGNHPDLGLRLHLDQASIRTTPASTRPLVLPTTSGLRRVFNVVTVLRTNPPKEELN